MWGVKLTRRITAVAVLAVHGIGAAADAAFEQAREQVAGPVGAVQPVGPCGLCHLDNGGVLLRDFLLAGLHRLPLRIVDDAEFEDLRGDPILRRVVIRDTRFPVSGFLT